MFRKTDEAKIELIAKYITDIIRIIERHGSPENAIDDYEGEYAILMCLTQIAETVNKISDTDFLTAIDVSGIKSFRNRIIHNYEGRDRKIILSILKNDLPELQKVIKP